MFTTQAQVIDYVVGSIPQIQWPNHNARLVLTIIPEDDFGVLCQPEQDEITDEILSLSLSALQKKKSHFTSL